MTCVHGPRGDIGAPCFGNDDCRAGAFCAMQSPRNWCTTFCTDDTVCGDHFSCQPAGGAMICVPDAALDGGACTTDADCVSTLCRGGTCVSDCTVGATCGPGLYCQRDEGGLTSSCRPAPPPPVVMPPPSGGCCTVAGTSGGAPAALVLVGVVALVASRRRKR
jgi:MYXO-CTERM domain-containing protein